MATVDVIINYLEELAPFYLAAEWDNSGLQIGNPEHEVSTVLVALDLEQQVLAEALDRQAQLIITHHPLWLKPPLKIDESAPPGTLITGIIRNHINVYSAHTNLDLALVNRLLADLIGLDQAGRKTIEVAFEDRLLKLVTFIPEGYEEKVWQALAAAGAGWIGNYSHCSFQVPGTGTFKPLKHTSPFIGHPGRLEKVPELRLETILPVSRCEKVITALLSAHPYEEVAYDLYPLHRPGEKLGFGLVGLFDPPLKMEDILKRCAEKLETDLLNYWVPPDRHPRAFRRVAVVSGSGGSLVEPAAQAGAELLVSGDIRHHDLLTASSYGMALIDAGHFWTEWPAIDYVVEYLRKRLAKDRYRTAVLSAGSDTAVRWKFYRGR